MVGREDQGGLFMFGMVYSFSEDEGVVVDFAMLAT